MSGNVILSEQKANELRAFGASLYDLDVHRGDFEKRMTKQTSMEPAEVKEIFTGYFDRMTKSHWSARDAYAMLQGPARFLYNGDFVSVRNALLKKVALEWASHNSDGSAYRECAEMFKDDPAARKFMADAVVLEAPRLAFSLADETHKKELAQRVIDAHKENPDYAGTVAFSLDLLGKQTELMQHMCKAAETDPAYAQKWAYQREKCGEVWIAVAQSYLASEDHKAACIAARFAAEKTRYASTPEEKLLEQKAKQLRTQADAAFIQNKPNEAFAHFTYKWGSESDGERSYTMEQMRDLALLFRQQEDYAQELQAWQTLEDIVLAQVEDSHRTLKELAKTNIIALGHRAYGDLAAGVTETKEGFDYAKSMAAMEWLAQGYQPLLAKPFIRNNVTDEHYGLFADAYEALAAGEPHEFLRHAMAAHDALTEIKKPTAQHKARMDAIADQVLTHVMQPKTEDYRIRDFFSNDAVRMNKYVDWIKTNKDAEKYYEWASVVEHKFNDSSRMDEARAQILAKSPSMGKALSFFKREKDAIGTQLALAKLAPNLPKEIITTFLPQ